MPTYLRPNQHGRADARAGGGGRWLYLLRGLRALRADLGPRFHLGILAYLGEAPQVLDDRLCLLPLVSLLGAVT